MIDLKTDFAPRVPEVIRDKASLVEGYLLDEGSVMRQQNDATILVLVEVQKQTTLTNGRVKQHDIDIATLQTSAQEWKKLTETISRYRGWLIAFFGVGGPFVLVFLEKLINKLWP
jgi:hypothetical protein